MTVDDATLDKLHEYAVAQEVARCDAMLRKDGLELIAKMNRHQLLIALDWADGSPVKANTARVRATLKKRFLSGDSYYDHYTLQNAYFNFNNQCS